MSAKRLTITGLAVAIIGLGVLHTGVAQAQSQQLPTNPALPCATETHKSSHVGFPHGSTTILFVNSSSATVNVFWLDYQGNRVWYATLLPGDSYIQETYLSHPWVITDESGNCLELHLALGTPSIATIH